MIHIDSKRRTDTNQSRRETNLNHSQHTGILKTHHEESYITDNIPRSDNTSNMDHYINEQHFLNETSDFINNDILNDQLIDTESHSTNPEQVLKDIKNNSQFENEEFEGNEKSSECRGGYLPMKNVHTLESKQETENTDFLTQNYKKEFKKNREILAGVFEANTNNTNNPRHLSPFIQESNGNPIKKKVDYLSNSSQARKIRGKENIYKKFDTSTSIDQKNYQQMQIQYAERLQTEISENPEPKTRWEALYSMGKKQKEQKMQAMLLKKKQEIEEMDAECTFHPNANRNRGSCNREINPVAFHDRAVLWKQNKDKRVDEARKNDIDKDAKECTFHPTINALNLEKLSQGSLTNNSNSYKGVEQFIRRQTIARQTKEEKEIILNNPLFKIPDTSTSKKTAANLTIPKSPNIGKSCQLLKKAMNAEFLNEDLKFDKYLLNQNSFSTENRHSTYLKEISSATNSVYATNVPFTEAMKMLHTELHNFDIKLD